MERPEFIQKYPELAREQDKAGNQSIIRLIAIISLGIAAIVGTKEYCTDEEFRKKMNEIVEKFNYEAMRQFG